MQNMKETESIIDISVLDDTFFIAILNDILARKKQVKNNALSTN